MMQVLLRPYGDDRVGEAVVAYRQHYGESGLLESESYPGIGGSLKQMQQAGLQVYLATSKRAIFARRIPEHLEFETCFDGIHGSVPSGELASTQGFFAGASVRNWASYGDGVTLRPEFPEWQRHLHTDPQTSGRLLIACDAAHGDAIAQQAVSEGYPFARIIGRVEQGPPAVKVLD